MPDLTDYTADDAYRLGKEDKLAELVAEAPIFDSGPYANIPNMIHQYLKLKPKTRYYLIVIEVPHTPRPPNTDKVATND